MKVLACLQYDEATSTCTTETWVEQPSLLPPMTTEQAVEISTAALVAFAAVMAIKVAFRKSQ